MTQLAGTWGGRLRAARPVLPYLLLMAVVLVGPVLFIFEHAFAGEVSWGTVLGDERNRSILLRTGVVAAQTTLICALVGYIFVAGLQMAGPRLRAVLIATLVLPLLTSYLVRIFGWQILLSSYGGINSGVRALFGDDAGLDLLYNRSGVLIGMVHVSLPLFVLPLYAVWSRVPPHLRTASRSLGAGRVETFLRVDLRLSLPGAAAGAVLVFIQATGFFVAPAFLGGQNDTVIAQLINQKIQQGLDLDTAAVLSVLLVLGVVAALLLFRVFFPLESLIIQDEQTSAVPARRGRLARLRRLPAGPHDALVRARLTLTSALDHFPWRTLTASGTALIVVYLLAPLGILFPVAFSGDAYLKFPPDSYSLRWFEAVFQDPVWRETALNSALAAVGAIAITFVVGLPLAFFLARGKAPVAVKSLLTAGVMTPVLVPSIVVALGIFSWFLDMRVIGRLWALSLAHALVGLPFLVIIVASALKDFDMRLEDAARSLGAGRRRVLRTVTLPLIGAAIAAGCLFTFLYSFDDLPIALAVTTPETQTLPVKLWNGAHEAVSPSLAAASVLLLALTAIGFACITVLNKTAQSRRANRG